MVKYVAGATAILTFMFGVWKIEDRYATAGDVAEQIYQLQQTDERQSLEFNELKKQLRYERLQKRVWAIEDRYGVGCLECDPEVLKAYRETELEMKELEE